MVTAITSSSSSSCSASSVNNYSDQSSKRLYSTSSESASIVSLRSPPRRKKVVQNGRRQRPSPSDRSDSSSQRSSTSNKSDSHPNWSQRSSTSSPDLGELIVSVFERAFIKCTPRKRESLTDLIKLCMVFDQLPDKFKYELCEILDGLDWQRIQFLAQKYSSRLDFPRRRVRETERSPQSRLRRSRSKSPTPSSERHPRSQSPPNRRVYVSNNVSAKTCDIPYSSTRQPPRNLMQQPLQNPSPQPPRQQPPPLQNPSPLSKHKPSLLGVEYPPALWPLRSQPQPKASAAGFRGVASNSPGPVASPPTVNPSSASSPGLPSSSSAAAKQLLSKANPATLPAWLLESDKAVEVDAVAELRKKEAERKIEIRKKEEEMKLDPNKVKRFDPSMLASRTNRASLKRSRIPYPPYSSRLGTGSSKGGTGSGRGGTGSSRGGTGSSRGGTGSSRGGSRGRGAPR